MQETILCQGVLVNNHLKVSAQWPLCTTGAEDVKHMLFECPGARLVWKSLGMQVLVEYPSNIGCNICYFSNIMKYHY
jgi:hypothetical protein